MLSPDQVLWFEKSGLKSRFGKRIVGLKIPRKIIYALEQFALNLHGSLLLFWILSGYPFCFRLSLKPQRYNFRGRFFEKQKGIFLQKYGIDYFVFSD
jgi:hypothetical protein